MYHGSFSSERFGVPQTLWAWFFLLIILFRFIPASVVSKPVSKVWNAAIGDPLPRLPRRGQLALAWIGALAITFGTAFGVPRSEGTTLADHGIPLAGIYVMTVPMYVLCRRKENINMMQFPISIILQQAMALFYFKSGAGFKFVVWFQTAVADFHSLVIMGLAFLFDMETAGKNWMFLNTFAIMVFVGAFFYILYMFTWMQWLTKHFAWFGQKVFGASGAETFQGLWSPWFGQAASPLLIAPYIYSYTDSEIAATMTIGALSTLVIDFYAANIGLSFRNIVGISAVVIPSSIMSAKIAFPEEPGTEPLTYSRESTAANVKKINLRKATDLLDALTDGTYVALKAAGGLLPNATMMYGMLLFVNGMLMWIFRGFGVHNLDVHRAASPVFVPFVFFLGVPRHEVWTASYMLSHHFFVSPDFAYGQLAALMAGPKPLSLRGFSLISMALANNACLASLGLQVGLMSTFIPASKKSSMAATAIHSMFIAIVRIPVPIVLNTVLTRRVSSSLLCKQLLSVQSSYKIADFTYIYCSGYRLE
ncbi:hypothetical protein M422DRAFT_181588 [Sphaerobolus stellatus SS14]|uniref:Unplaced genomic scaffold SPHSTscaffold_120, whole genome shotgun sequence n=1 Tax=Sphaerobolus stellatus (strain SS14) TaxID=990650 RepID=A0A0C9UJ00_SPHS4|nr:hypothetical protein M422DRAFT_181588 [Sphaerobolus stellatus SS14]